MTGDEKAAAAEKSQLMEKTEKVDDEKKPSAPPAE